MKKLGLATSLVLTLAFGAGSVFATQNSNNSNTGGTMTASASRRHHRRHHRKMHRHHRKAKAANANT